MGHLPIGASSGPGSPGRRRGLSAPGSFTPLTQPGAAGWTTSYRTALPPLTVPDSHPSSLSAHPHNGMYHSHPLTPADEPPSSSAYTPMSTYSSATSASNGRDMILPSPSSYSYQTQDPHWSYSSNGPSSASSGSLSSLLNPHTGSTTSSYASARPTPHINTYSSSPYTNLPGISRAPHQGGASPESRPTTGYSASSLSSLPTPFDETAPHSFDYSRPGSSHRPLTPGSSRPSSKASYNTQTLSVRRDRRHSHAMSPYPLPYSDHPSSERPSTSPHPGENHPDAGLPRVRSMQTMNMSNVNETYGYNPAQADFAFGAVDDHHSGPGVSGGGGGGSHGGMYGRSVRPSTSASSLSGSSSAANTPGAEGGYGQGHGDNVDINRCE